MKNMPTKRKTSRKSNRAKWLLVLAVAVVIVVVGGLLLYRHHQAARKVAAVAASSGVNPINTVDYSPGTPADNSANEARKGSDTPPPTLGSSGGQANFSVQIVSANPSTSNVHVGTLVGGATTGDCTLTASKSGQSVLQLGTSIVHQDVNTYSCGVFNVSPQSFPVSGTWQLKLTVVSNGNTGSDTSNVTITR